MNLKILGLILFFLCQGCATMSNRSKSLIATGVGGIVGGAVGSITAKNNDKPEAHALLWAGVGSATMGALSFFIFDEQKRSEQLEQTISILKKEVAVLRGEMGPSLGSQMIFESSESFKKELPPQYQSLIRPGKWSLYQIDQWITQSDGVMIHQDKMMKLIPPQFNPMKISGTLEQKENIKDEL